MSLWRTTTHSLVSAAARSSVIATIPGVSHSAPRTAVTSSRTPRVSIRVSADRQFDGEETRC